MVYKVLPDPASDVMSSLTLCHHSLGSLFASQLRFPSVYQTNSQSFKHQVVDAKRCCPDPIPEIKVLSVQLLGLPPGDVSQLSVI